MNIINEFNTEILDSNQGDKIRIVVVISEFRLWGMGLINVDFVVTSLITLRNPVILYSQLFH